MSHFAGDKVERLFRDAFIKRIAHDLPGVQIGAAEQGVIVEHLLEMVYPIVQTELCFQHGYQSVVMV